MKNYLIIITSSIFVALVTTLILKSFGVENAAIFSGGIAGGISGALASILLNKKDK